MTQKVGSVLIDRFKQILDRAMKDDLVEKELGTALAELKAITSGEASLDKKAIPTLKKFHASYHASDAMTNGLEVCSSLVRSSAISSTPP